MVTKWHLLGGAEIRLDCRQIQYFSNSVPYILLSCIQQLVHYVHCHPNISRFFTQTSDPYCPNVCPKITHRNIHHSGVWRIKSHCCTAQLLKGTDSAPENSSFTNKMPFIHHHQIDW